jgi:hypothetical protein
MFWSDGSLLVGVGGSIPLGNQAQTNQSQQAPKSQAKPIPVQPAGLGMEMAGLAPLLPGLSAAVGDGTVETQVKRLSNPLMASSQRHALTVQIASLQGNRHVQGLVQRLPAKPAAASSVAASPVHSFVQRQPNPAEYGPPLPPLHAAVANQGRAQEILMDTFGNIKKIVKGELELVDKDTAHEHHDAFLIGKKTWNSQPWADRPWESGDSKLIFRTFYGFADTGAGIIYIVENPGGASGASGGDQQMPTIVHEMLHINAAGDFASTVKGTIDEGTTELLTGKAMQKAGMSFSPEYQGQIAFVNALIGLVSEGTLTSAYFGGASILVSAFEAIRGEGSWARLMDYMSRGKTEKVRELIEGPANQSILEQKIAQIENYLSGWVSDEDINQIAAIVSTLTRDEKRTVHSRIADSIDDLMNFGQRARLRIMLGG